MSLDDLMERAQFGEALTELRALTDGPGADPGMLLMRFNMEVRLQLFDAAYVTMDRLCAAAPNVAPVMKPLGLAARAEQLATERLSSADLAQKRSTMGIPPPQALALGKAMFLHAQRDHQGAAEAIKEARSLTAPLSGMIEFNDGQQMPFTALVDTDELTGATLPCYNGATLLDLAYSQINMVKFLPIKTSFDGMWRPADVILSDGQALSVRVPALYPGAGVDPDEQIRAGTSTQWSHDTGYAVAKGQRDLSLTTSDGGSALVGVQRISAIYFKNPIRQATQPASGGAMAPSLPSSAGKPWSTLHKIVFGIAGALALLLFLRGSFFYALFPDGGRALVLLLGCASAAAIGWVLSQVSSRNAAIGGALMVFLIAAGKWLL